MHCVACHTPQPALRSTRIGAAVCSRRCADAAAPDYVLARVGSPVYEALARAPALVAVSSGGAHAHVRELAHVGGRVPVRASVARAIQRIGTGPNVPVTSSSSDAARAAAAADTPLASSSAATSASAATPAPAEQRGTKRTAEPADEPVPKDARPAAAGAGDVASGGDLPVEMLAHIAEFMALADLVTLMAVSRMYAALARETVRRRFERLYNEIYAEDDEHAAAEHAEAGRRLLHEMCSLAIGGVETVMRIALADGALWPDARDCVYALSPVVTHWVYERPRAAPPRTSPFVVAAVVYRELVMWRPEALLYSTMVAPLAPSVTPMAIEALYPGLTAAYAAITWALPEAYALYGQISSSVGDRARHLSYDIDSHDTASVAIGCIILSIASTLDGRWTNARTAFASAEIIIAQGDADRLARVLASVCRRYHSVARRIDEYLYDHDFMSSAIGRYFVAKISPLFATPSQANDIATALRSATEFFSSRVISQLSDDALFPHAHAMASLRLMRLPELEGWPEDVDPNELDSAASEYEDLSYRSISLIDDDPYIQAQTRAELAVARAEELESRQARGRPRAERAAPPVSGMEAAFQVARPRSPGSPSSSSGTASPPSEYATDDDD